MYKGIKKGMYLLEEDTRDAAHHVQLMGSGTILREVREAAKILRDEFNVGADVWSVTSFNELRREALEYDRQQFLDYDEKREKPWVVQQLDGVEGPVIASTDYMKLYADQIRAWVPTDFHVLGTDGFGRSDTREQLRRFFEVDRYYVTIQALRALANRGEIDIKVVNDAMKKYGIDPAKPSPLLS